MKLIWATRGRSWGYRFLRDGGFEDPLPVYDAAFSGVGDEPDVCRRVAEIVVLHSAGLAGWQDLVGAVALRFPDPYERKDRAGRVIPHDFVVFPPEADQVTSVEEGLRFVWPEVAEDFERDWKRSRPRPTSR